MSFLGGQSVWQRHVAIDGALLAYYDLALRFPAAAGMAASGKVNHRPDTDYEFTDGDSFSDILEGIFGGTELSPEQEAENAAWRSYMKAAIAIISQIYFAATFEDKVIARHDATQKHRDQSIATIVGELWRSFDGRSWHHYFADDDLVNLVGDLVTRQQELHAWISEPVEQSNA